MTDYSEKPHVSSSCIWLQGNRSGTFTCTHSYDLCGFRLGLWLGRHRSSSTDEASIRSADLTHAVDR